MSKMMNNEQNYAGFFDAIEDMLFVLSMDGFILHANRAAKEKLGYPGDELIGMNVLEVHPHRYREEALRVVGEMVAGRLDFCPIPLLTKNGQENPVETRVWKGAWNGEDCLCGISKDMTRQYALLERFYALFNNNPALLSVTNAVDRRFIEINESFCQVLGYNREEIIGKTHQDVGIFTAPDDHSMVAQKLLKEGSISGEHLLVRRKDGVVLDGLFWGKHIQNQTEDILLTQMIDVTEFFNQRKKVQQYYQSIEENKNLLAQIIDAMTDVVFYKDKDGRYLECNKAFANDYPGLDRSQIIGKTDREIIPDLEMVEHFISTDRQILDSGESQTFEEILQIRDGRKAVMETKKIPIFNLNGSISGILGVSRDITSRIEALNELSQAKLKAESFNLEKTRFIGNVSHEIRNGVNGIQGLLNLLVQSESEEDKKLYTEKARTAAMELLALTNDLTSISHMESGRFVLSEAPFSLLEMIDSTLSSMQSYGELYKVNLAFCGSGPLPETVIGDSLRIRQILTNLLTNAIKFSPGGRVTLNLQASPIQSGKSVISFSVKDNGIGIKKEDLPRILLPFTQVAGGGHMVDTGNGLGLFIVASLAELMGGQLKVDSEYQKGSVFEFRLEMKVVDSENRKTSAVKPAEIEEPIGKPSVSVLIAEDDPLNQFVLSEFFQKEGIPCEITSNGSQALECWMSRRHPVVLLDVLMPEMDGIDLAKSIRQLEGDHRTTKLFCMSASVGLQRQEENSDLMDEWVEKPIRFDDLVQRIHQALR